MNLRTKCWDSTAKRKTKHRFFFLKERRKCSPILFHSTSANAHKREQRRKTESIVDWNCKNCSYISVQPKVLDLRNYISTVACFLVAKRKEKKRTSTLICYYLLLLNEIIMAKWTIVKVRVKILIVNRRVNE